MDGDQAMTKAELEVLYTRVVGALDKEFHERGWLPPGQPQSPSSTEYAQLSQIQGKETQRSIALEIWLDQREAALRQIADLAPEERVIPLDRAFFIVREMASVARNELSAHSRPLRSGET